jgi:hypothetical protein
MTQKIFKYKRPIDYHFYIVVLIGVILVYGIAFYRVFSSYSQNYSIGRIIITLLFTLLILSIIFVLIQIIIMYKQYDKVDHNKIIEVNDDLRSMIIKQKDSQDIFVRNEDIEKIEVFEPWSAGYPLGYFSYVKINLKQNNSITITGFTLPLGEFDVLKVLKGIKRVRYTKFFNKINYC